MKFGKEIQSQQIPGWSQYYLDYKALKKIISAAHKSIPDNTSPFLEAIRPSDVFIPSAADPSPRSSSALPPDADVSEPLAIPVVVREEDRGPEFQRCKAMFFFKLERELEKINSFYLQKEAELKFRLATLLSKRRAAKQRSVANIDGSLETHGVEWTAVKEGFRSLDKDLSKLQQFIELNATGFRKILKKWDKRSKSRTKELYLARQVEVQPCFNRELISELSDTLAACLMDPENGATDVESLPADTVLREQLSVEATCDSRRNLGDFERNLVRAATSSDETTVRGLLEFAKTYLSRSDADRTHIFRILWRAAIPAAPSVADLIITSEPFDLGFVDDINGRTSLHGAALAGELRLVDLCLTHGIAVNRQDVYGRSALHYAAINGHGPISQRLLSADADANLLDMDGHTPLIYAVVNGHGQCVRILADDGHVSVGAPAPTSNLLPLSLACQHGHLDIAIFLLDKGAVSAPNSNGEYPIHLAAREGHADVCRLLVSQKEGGNKDTPDKYSEWTPLFHAAQRGFEECVHVLLDASANPQAMDEHGKTAVFYAAWHGHVKCTNKLLDAMASYPLPHIHFPNPFSASQAMTASLSPCSASNHSPFDHSSLGGAADADMDLDMIPLLSLPPPIMPFRIYGHNYLDKMHLLQVSLGGTTDSPVTLLPSAMRHTEYTGRLRAGHEHVAPSVKVVMALRPNEADPDTALIASHSTTLPLADNGEVFSFQTRSLTDITLEFSFYPTFGSKAIGRAVASPQTLQSCRSSPRSVPILDHRLHVIGKISFESLIITPFSEVALEIGGAVETYWKSTAVSSFDMFSPSSDTSTRFSSTTSPNLRTPSLPVNTAATNKVTLSSLSGEFVHIVVQVTRDRVPVIFPDWNLPVEDDQFDIGVADVSAAQFAGLGARLGKELDNGEPPTSAAGWHRFLSQKMCTLKEILQSLPVAYGVSLELRYPNPVIRDRYHLGHHHEPNAFVDSVLEAVYSVSQSLPVEAPRRKIVFSSFVPAICTTINWKQPNYAVFFSSKCGVARGPGLQPSGKGLLADEEEGDSRCRSVNAAVQFAKSNNLLGVIFNANLLTAIPSLIQGIKELGVILAVFGSQAQLGTLNSMFASATADAPKIDATLNDGVLSYIDHILAPPF